MSTPNRSDGVHPELRELREQQARPRSKGRGWSPEQRAQHEARMALIRQTQAEWDAEQQRLQFLPLEELLQEIYDRAAVGALAFYAEAPKPVTIVRLWGAVPLAEAAYRAWVATLEKTGWRDDGDYNNPDPFKQPLPDQLQACSPYNRELAVEHAYYWQIRELERRASVLRVVVGMGLQRAGYVFKGVQSVQRGLKLLLDQERARAYGWTEQE